MFFGRKAFVSLLLMSALPSAAFADSLSAPNRVAGSEALAEMKLDQGNVETAAFESGLAKLRATGVLVGPLCIELRNGCFTQRELAYHSSEYYLAGGFELPKAGLYTSAWDSRFPQQAMSERFRSVARANGVDELILFNAITFKERLERAYLRSYSKSHPNTPPREFGGSLTTYSWSVDEDGHVVETSATSGGE
jgi:hypothetical protein